MFGARRHAHVCAHGNPPIHPAALPSQYAKFMRKKMSKAECIHADGSLNMEYFRPMVLDNITWTEDTVHDLLEGIKQHGVGKWSQIQEDFLPMLVSERRGEQKGFEEALLRPVCFFRTTRCTAQNRALTNSCPSVRPPAVTHTIRTDPVGYPHQSQQIAGKAELVELPGLERRRRGEQRRVV
jgi:hypothetical protein